METRDILKNLREKKKTYTKSFERYYKIRKSA